MQDRPIISRQSAWQAGKLRYYTGGVCKRGHFAERYVSNGACIECVGPYKVGRHPYDSNLIPYASPRLWVRKGLTAQEYVALQDYLQTCVNAFCKSVRPDEPEPMFAPP